MRYNGYETSLILTGWLTVIGWQALCAGAGYLSANLIQGLASLTHPNYHPHPYQVTLLLWAVIVLSVFINAIGGTFLPKFEGLILILHCLGYFAILLPLVVLGEHQNSSQVFDVFLNGGNWPTEGLSFMIGLTGSIFVFVGMYYLLSERFTFSPPTSESANTAQQARMAPYT